MGSRSPGGRGGADRGLLRPGSQHPPEGNKEPHRGFKQKYHDQACVLYRSLLQHQAEKSLKASTVCGRATKQGPPPHPGRKCRGPEGLQAHDGRKGQGPEDFRRWAHRS